MSHLKKKTILTANNSGRPECKTVQTKWQEDGCQMPTESMKKRLQFWVASGAEQAASPASEPEKPLCYCVTYTENL